MHISHCKRFQEKTVNVGKETPPPGDAIPKQKKGINRMKLHNTPSCCRFEVRFGGLTHPFNDPDCFLLWLQDRGDASNDDVYLQAVLTRVEVGSQEVTTFFRKELRLAPPLVHWQRRTLWYLRNRFCEEWEVFQAREEDFTGDKESCKEELVSPADDVTEVMTLAPGHPVMPTLSYPLGLEGINTAPASQGDTLVGSLILHTLLSLQTSQQLQPPLQSKSPALFFCSSRRQSGPMVALGWDLLLNASPRTPGIQSGEFFVV